jgi:hypothetical protein
MTTSLGKPFQLSSIGFIVARKSRSWVVTPGDDNLVGGERVLDVTCPVCKKLSRDVSLFSSKSRRITVDLNCGHYVIVGPQYGLPWLNETPPQDRFSKILAVGDFARLLVNDCVDRYLHPFLMEINQHLTGGPPLPYLKKGFIVEFIIDVDVPGSPSVGLQSVWVKCPVLGYSELNEIDSPLPMHEWEFGEFSIFPEAEVQETQEFSKLSQLVDGLKDFINLSEAINFNIQMSEARREQGIGNFPPGFGHLANSRFQN